MKWMIFLLGLLVLGLGVGQTVFTLWEGGPTHQGVSVTCDLPASSNLRQKNVGGRDGLGLCVFTSIGHAARYQDEHRLWDFQKNMQQEPGGGWPEKVDSMIAKYGKGTLYLQYEGRDPSILEAALKTGRMPAITYDGRDMHYQGQHVEHMVNLVHLDKTLACILDNNFIGENELVWMSREEFLSRWYGGQGRHGWAVILLSASPCPVPHN
jgi:hypothetical protein